MPACPFAAPVGTPAYAALTEQLRKEIVSGLIPHGTRLTIAYLVERYGVSQMPVREALQSLQGEGLVKILPHRGARVLSLDASFVRNVYEIREAIEVLLVRSSLHNLCERDLKALEGVQTRFAPALAHADGERVFTLNREFHYLLYSRSGNGEALRIYGHYNSLMGALRRAYDFGPARRQRMAAEHEETLAAVRAGDEDGVVASIRGQAQRGRDDLLASMGRM